MVHLLPMCVVGALCNVVIVVVIVRVIVIGASASESMHFPEL